MICGWLSEKQGRIHGWPSRVRVGRGSDEIDQQGSLAGAVTPKPPINVKKAECYRLTDRQTDRQTDRHTDRQTDRRTEWVVESRARD